VRPPDFAIAEAMKLGLDVEGLIGEPSQQLCCTESAPISMPAEAPKACCCSQALADDTSDSSSAHRQPPRRSASMVVAWRALQCQGHNLEWRVAGPVLPVPANDSTEILPFLEWLEAARSGQAIVVSLEPDVPPPRQGVVL
jgi:hypothetical protein